MPHPSKDINSIISLTIYMRVCMFQSGACWMFEDFWEKMLHTGDGSLIVIEGMEKLFNSNTTVNFHVSLFLEKKILVPISRLTSDFLLRILLDGILFLNLLGHFSVKYLVFLIFVSLSYEFSLFFFCSFITLHYFFFHHGYISLSFFDKVFNDSAVYKVILEWTQRRKL